jgi:multicomponent Na+:H+ antiporter subunit E
MVKRVAALTLWAFGAWLLLTWTRTTSQLLFGLALSLVVAFACAHLGPVAAPWTGLVPRRMASIVLLVLSASLRVIRANVSLAHRIWTPSRPLRSGMVIVPTEMTSEGGLTVVGLITSVIVDNQLVDLDVGRQELQYHGVWIPSGDEQENRSRINGPVEGYLKRIVDG